MRVVWYFLTYWVSGLEPTCLFFQCNSLSSSLGWAKLHLWEISSLDLFHWEIYSASCWYFLIRLWRHRWRGPSVHGSASLMFWWPEPLWCFCWALSHSYGYKYANLEIEFDHVFADYHLWQTRIWMNSCLGFAFLNTVPQESLPLLMNTTLHSITWNLVVMVVHIFFFGTIRQQPTFFIQYAWSMQQHSRTCMVLGL